MEFLDYILDAIFPQKCGICEKIGEGYICNNCLTEIEKYILGKESKKGIFHLLKYDGIIREKMISYKFNDKSYLHSMFCEIFVKNKNACEFLKNYDIIIPVPIHKKRMKQRGYNQSELIAKKIAKELDILIYTDVLKKKINTIPQSSLGKQDREKNVQNVYKVENTQKIVNNKVVILDDIYTTGATVNECKNALQLSGAKEVGIITIAKD